MTSQRVFYSDPPAPTGSEFERRIERASNLVDALATGNMRVLWICVNRDKASLPDVEQARKQVELTADEVRQAWRTYLARTTEQVRSSQGAADLTEWYGNPATLPGQRIQPTLFGLEAR